MFRRHHHPREFRSRERTVSRALLRAWRVRGQLRPTMRRTYLLTRNLHLYVGLFISPFILLFAVSVFVLLHGGRSSGTPEAPPETRTVTGVRLQPGTASLQGRPRIEALRPVLDGLGVYGEVDFIRHVPSDRRIVIPVRVPGRETIVTIDYDNQVAVITSRPQPFGDALAYLHRMPGPHNVAPRGNAPFMRLWRVMADMTAYLIVFLTLTGVYLWTALRAERLVGFVLLIAGASSVSALVYALVR